MDEFKVNMAVGYWFNLKTNSLLDTKIVKIRVSSQKSISSKFRLIETRRIYSALANRASLYAVELSDEEIEKLEPQSPVQTLREILDEDKADWSTIGMILKAISSHGSD